MKRGFYIIICLAFVLTKADARNAAPAFHWGNGFYYNLDKGERVTFRGQDIQLLQLHNHFNQLKIGQDTVWLKVSRRTLPHSTNGIRIFVADNKNVKALTTDKQVHGLLKKDALICLSDLHAPLLEFNKFIFPVSFSDGFLWSGEEASYFFSYPGSAREKGEEYPRSHEGIDIDLHHARGKEKHWLVAIENSRVVWVENKGLDEAGNEACILLESESHPGIYYLYEHLYNKNVVVKEGQKLIRGEPLGTIWGDQDWGHLHFSVVKSDSVPSYSTRYYNVVNGFPQVYELYFRQTSSYSKNFSKGRIYFGRHRAINGNQKNVMAYESYSGKGWDMKRWNTTDKVEWVMKGSDGNVRLKKVLFEGSKAACENPQDHYDFEINVRNGTYRIRAKLGDLFLPSWQKIEFEGVSAGEYALEPGQSEWTSERAVEVDDGKLTVRIFMDETNKKAAGLSQVVFQKAY